MKYLETKEEKISFTISTSIIVVLLILFFYLGLSYLDPPPENGIAINFGNTEMGSGENKTSTETVQSAPQPTSSSQPTPSSEELTTQDIEDAPVIKETQKPSKKPTEESVKPKPVEKPQPSKTTTDALSNLLNGPKSDGKNTEGEGPDKTHGNKGALDGDPYANSYYGSGTGKVGGKGWGLNGRTISSKANVDKDCNEIGIVVIEIWVNRSGNVINAQRSKGTENPAPCLVNPAIAAAKKYKWQSDPKAPEKQVGFIIFNYTYN